MAKRIRDVKLNIYAEIVYFRRSLYVGECMDIHKYIFFNFAKRLNNKFREIEMRDCLKFHAEEEY